MGKRKCNNSPGETVQSRNQGKRNKRVKLEEASDAVPVTPVKNSKIQSQPTTTRQARVRVTRQEKSKPPSRKQNGKTPNKSIDCSVAVLNRTHSEDTDDDDNDDFVEVHSASISSAIASPLQNGKKTKTTSRSLTSSDEMSVSFDSQPKKRQKSQKQTNVSPKTQSSSKKKLKIEKSHIKKEKEASDGFAAIESAIFGGACSKTEPMDSDDEEEFVDVNDAGADSSSSILSPLPSTSKSDHLSSALLSQMDVASILKLGEGLSQDPSFSMDNSDNSDWEEVEDGQLEEKEHKIPSEGVQITLENSDVVGRKKRGFDINDFLRLRVNRIRRYIQENVHKVHVVCLIAHGQLVNRTLNSQSLLATGLSIVPSAQCYPPKHMNLTYLEKVMKWFRTKVKLEKGNPVVFPFPLEETLQKCFTKGMANSPYEFVCMFVVVLRALGIDTRLVMSLQPVLRKPATDQLIPPPSKKSPNIKEEEHTEEKDETNNNTPKKSPESKTSTVKSSSSKSAKKKSLIPTANSNMVCSPKPGSTNKTQSSKKPDKSSVTNAVKERETPGKSGAKHAHKTSSKKPEKPSTLRAGSKQKPHSDISTVVKPSRKVSSKTVESLRARSAKMNYSEMSDASDTDGKCKGKKASTSSTVKKRKHSDSEFAPETDAHCTSDSDFEPSQKKLRLSPDEKKKRHSSTSDKKSSPQRRYSSSKQEKVGMDIWLEVYLEEEESWTPINIISGKLHCASDLQSKATQPIQYVLAFNVNDSIKDVTRRYASRWHTQTRKLRIDEKWLTKTLRPYKGPQSHKNKKEDQDFADQQQQQPIPKTIGECKAHPLYVLKRHLLKFEALYPADCPPLGYVNKEEVYARECVHTLHSRETWLKEAKVVRAGEKAYKIVKARPKYDWAARKFLPCQPLEIFGPWQVDDYVPPTAVDGKVPRNAYGNVELFKPSMLPKGTVHLRLPNLMRLAKKLGIDCANAFIGWDFTSGGNHPAFDGYVVCEEFKEILIEAWHQEEEERKRREEEKREKRVLDNWKRLIKGLLIRERLKKKYNFGKQSVKSTDATEEGASTSTKKE